MSHLLYTFLNRIVILTNKVLHDVSKNGLMNIKLQTGLIILLLGTHFEEKSFSKQFKMFEDTSRAAKNPILQREDVENGNNL